MKTKTKIILGLAAVLVVWWWMKRKKDEDLAEERHAARVAREPL